MLVRIILLIKGSLQQKNHFYGIIFGNNCCRSNEGSLCYLNEKLRSKLFPEFEVGAYALRSDCNDFEDDLGVIEPNRVPAKLVLGAICGPANYTAAYGEAK